MKKKTKKYKTYKVIRNKMKITSYNQFRKLISSRFGIKPYTVDIGLGVFAIITIAQLIDSILGIIRFFI
jgi:hypothetical protein